MFGFIIVRNVTSYLTNQYWVECYRCIRRLYPETPILIVDDNSDPSFVVPFYDSLYKCSVLASEFPGAGELLGYYYLLKTRMFDEAVVLHDSVFLQQRLSLQQGPVRFLWHFRHDWDDADRELRWLKRLRHHEPLVALYKNKRRWYGCFGVQSFIHRGFLEFIDAKYSLFSTVLPLLNNRADRMCMERVFAVLCTLESSDLQARPSIYGDISRFPLGWGYSFLSYQKEAQHASSTVPAIKVWTGR